MKDWTKFYKPDDEAMSAIETAKLFTAYRLEEDPEGCKDMTLEDAYRIGHADGAKWLAKGLATQAATSDQEHK